MILKDKTGEITALKNYTIEKYQKHLPKPTNDQIQERLAILSNRMEKIETYAKENNPYFHHLYHLSLNKIRTYYHQLNGLSRVELSKCFRMYTDPNYKDAFYITKLPTKEFIDQYLYAINEQNLTIKEKLEAIEKLYEITIKGFTFDKNNHHFQVESRNIGFNCSINPPQIITMHPQIIPEKVFNKIGQFINKMNYINNEHCLGLFVYGSSTTGFATKNSDIDVRIVFDDTNPEHLYRGAMTIDGIKIEYLEQPLRDLYLTIENDFQNNQNNACLSIIGKSKIAFERYGYLRQLQQYAINRYQEPLEPLTEDKAKEGKAILKTRMQKLQKYAKEDAFYFETYRQYVLSEIRKLYHSLNGISEIQTSKVYRIYTDKAYRESMYKDIPEQEFVDTFLELIKPNKNKDKLTLYKEVEDLYTYTTQTINLGTNFKILIKSRRNKLSKSNQLNTLIQKRVN